MIQVGIIDLFSLQLNIHDDSIVSNFVYLAYLGGVGAKSPSICPKITTRKRWGALAAKNVEYQIFPIETVVIHHTVTPRCNTKLKCSNALVNMQNYNKNELNGDDIAYK